MKHSQKYSLVTAAALAMAVSAAKAQTLVYSFETLYDSTNNPNPAGTYPDDFQPNPHSSGTTITQSTIGVTNGNYSMDFTQGSADTFTGAYTTLLPAAVNSNATVAIGVDLTVPSTGTFTGTFAAMGISEFGNNTLYGVVGQPVQTTAQEEVNIDLAPGSYHFTIPLIARSDPLTGQSNVPFSTVFGPDPNTQLTMTAFEFYINKNGAVPLTVYLDNVTAIGPATDGTWANSTSGSWSTLSDWTGGIPQVALDTANLAGAITGSSTITLDGNRSLAVLNISNSNQYTIAQGSGGTLTFDAGGSTNTSIPGGTNVSSLTVSTGSHAITAPVDFNTNTIITVSNAGNSVTLSGPVSGLGGLTVAGNGTVDLSGANSYIGGTTVNSGTLLVGSNQSLPSLNSVVNIKAGAKMQFATGIGGVTIQTPTIATGGILDISNNHLIINYGSGADPISTVQQLLTSGYNGGAWNGAGINTSAPLVVGGLSYGLGYADSADPGNPAGLSSGTLEIKYTLLGDADLNGIVNGLDFGILAANFNKGVTGWDKGDFDYNNIVNGIDFGFLAANFNKGAAGAAVGVPAYDDPAIMAFAAANGLLADVPEPASVGLLVFASAGFLARRRRRK